MSEQQLFFVHSKKDPLNNEEERSKLMAQFYPEAVQKKESLGNHRHLTNSEVIHHDRGHHSHLDPQPSSALKVLNAAARLKGGKTADADINFRKFPLKSDTLKYRVMKPGTNCVARHCSDFVAKYPFCHYLTPQEIHQAYNSKQFVTLERQDRIFKYTDEGEFQLVDKDILESQRGVITDVIKQALGNLVKGKGLMRVSMPIRLFEPVCAYEVIARFTGYMDKLYDAIHAKPGIDRLRQVMAWVCGGFIQSVNVRKPFNNIIGETMNAEYPDGTKIYAEHINHDPPIEMIFVVNEDAKFRLYGNLETTVSLGTNDATILIKGVLTLEIGDDKMYIQVAPVVNKGLLHGTLRVCGRDAFYFYYPGHELKGLIGIGDKQYKDAIYGGVYWAANDMPIDTDTFRKSLFPSIEDKKLAKERCISEASGRLYQAVNFDGKQYWNRDQRIYGLHISDRVLPSDWLFRDDILWLWRGNPELAMKWKTQLEDVNREWRKAREAYRKKNKHLFE